MATMKFNTRNLRDALGWVVNHVDLTPSRLEDSALLVSPPKDGHVVLAGGRDQSAGRARIPYEGDEFTEEQAIHAHTLNMIVKTAPGENVELVLKDDGVLVKSGSAKSKVNYLNAAEVSAARASTSIPRQGSIPTAKLIDVLGSLSTIPQEKDVSHPEIAGVKLQFSEGTLALAATDRTILGATQIPVNVPADHPNADELTLDALVPNYILQAIVRTLPSDGDVWLHWDPTNLTRLALSTDDLWASFGLLAASDKFPKYEPLLEVESTTTIEVDRKALTATLSRAAQALGKDGSIVGLTAETQDDTASEFTVKASGVFTHEEVLPARVSGEPLSPGLVSSRHVAQAVKAAKGDVVTLGLSAQFATITSDHSEHAKFVIPRIKTR